MARAAPTEDWPRAIAEFEAWHALRPDRWEFIGGQPRMMAPGSMRHSIIKSNVFRALDKALGDRDGTVLVDGPQIVTDEISAIPDVVVTCAPADLSSPSIAQPVIIVEVMSQLSEADDTGRKWLSYQKIPSLRHYLVLAQDRRLVHIHSRSGELWRERFVSEGSIDLDEPQAQVDVAALYATTDLAA